jgi:predicted anti-sigma-YlaC factor YlaD
MSFRCAELTAALSEQAAGELGIQQEAALEAHLRECPACRSEAQQLRAFLATVQPAPLSEAELRTLERLPGRVRAALERRPASRWRIPAVMVAAAAVAVFAVWTRPIRHAASPRATVSADEEVPFGEERFLSGLETDEDSASDATATDAAMLEGPGLFGNLDG